MRRAVEGLRRPKADFLVAIDSVIKADITWNLDPVAHYSPSVTMAQIITGPPISRPGALR